MLVVLGNGGHAQSLLDVVDCTRTKAKMVDNAQEYLAKHFLPSDVYVVAIGDNERRAQVYNLLRELGGTIRQAIHHKAHVSDYAQLEEGCQILPFAVVGPRSTLGRGTIVNTSAVVEHDCQVGEFCHIAPHATLLGGVRLGRGVLIGAGAVVGPQLLVGDWAVVGMGAVTTKHVLPAAVVTGVPAK